MILSEEKKGVAKSHKKKEFSDLFIILVLTLQEGKGNKRSKFRAGYM